MHARLDFRHRAKHLGDAGVIEIRLRSQDLGQRALDRRRRNDDGCRPCGRQLVPVFRIGKECQIAGAGIRQSADAGNHGCTGTDQVPA